MKPPHVPIDDMQSAKTSSKDAAAIVEAERADLGITEQSLPITRTTIVSSNTIVLDLNDAELEKLSALARAKNKSMEECLKTFIATCQPTGHEVKYG